jgi:branched-subunit amino acid aminotransferase/4-amino-4-deoxychorismate lyase
MSAATTYRWRDGALEPRDHCDIAPAVIEAADSWLVTDGQALALDVHRSRFFTAIPRGRFRQLDPAAFWDAAIAAIPRDGDWFPRVELRSRLRGPELLFRLREAPVRHRSITLATFHGRDPRRSPRVKGPDLEAMLRLRTEAQSGGADEAVLLSPEGWVAEGSTTCLAWWRGDALAIPDPEISRIDSVTLRTALVIATALDIDVLHEEVRPEDLEGLEVWALNALHGIRIVTRWIDGPATAELPGRRDQWQRRLDALRRPLPGEAAA